MIQFWAPLTRFRPAGGLQITLNCGVRPLSAKLITNPRQSWCIHLLGDCSELIFFRGMLAQFRSFSGQTVTENGGFRQSSGNHSLSPIEIWCVHYLESLKIIRFWVTLVQFRPAGGPQNN